MPTTAAPKVVTPLKSLSVSAKAKLAGLLPVITALLTVLITWAVSGAVDTVALVAALSQVGAGVVAFIGAYLGLPGEVVVDPVDVEDAPVAP